MFGKYTTFLLPSDISVMGNYGKIIEQMNKYSEQVKKYTITNFNKYSYKE